MQIKELLQYNDIVIQCHNNPDADAVASGWALLCYLEQNGKQARLIYSGEHRITKANMVLLCEKLQIPIEYVEKLEEKPELLICVDCRYGGGNVRKFEAEAFAVIDHHPSGKNDPKLPKLNEVRDKYGACSTIIWDMMMESGFDPADNVQLATALFYGLFMDTARLQELRHPKDMDMRDALQFRCQSDLMFMLQNCNLSEDDLETTGMALMTCKHYSYSEDRKFSIVSIKQCDPNLLGVISDLVMENEKTDVCVAFCVQLNPDENSDSIVKFSVRSCLLEARADYIASFLAKGIGGGGGHPRKSGGTLRNGVLEVVHEPGFSDTYGFKDKIHQLFFQRLQFYMKAPEIYYAGEKAPKGDAFYPEITELFQTGAVYQKNCMPVGYVKASDLYEAGTQICVRMLEGDITFVVEEDTYLMLGIDAEVYQNKEKDFRKNNDLSDAAYCFTGEYPPRVIWAQSDSKDVRELAQYAKTCIPKEGARIRAKQLDCRVKIIPDWSKDGLLGEPSDWLVVREDNIKDFYIIKNNIFVRSYTLVKEREIL